MLGCLSGYNQWSELYMLAAGGDSNAPGIEESAAFSCCKDQAVPVRTAPYRPSAQDYAFDRSIIENDQVVPGPQGGYADIFVGYAPFQHPQVSQAPSEAVHYHYHHFKPVFIAPPVVPWPSTKAKASTLPIPEFPLTMEPPKVSAPQKAVVENKPPQERSCCAHCRTESTSLWRKVGDDLMCNACALYLKLHGFNRPLHLNTGVVKRRNRLGSHQSRRHRRHKC